jgi:inorganic pyrophosphatase
LVPEEDNPTHPCLFWAYLDQLVSKCSVIIDRPVNSHHPRYPEIIYPLDYGYLEGTKAVDGSGVDCWLGASGIHELTAIILTVDIYKRDAEIKIVLGCTDEEMQLVLDFQNTKNMRALLVRRPVIQEEFNEHTP